MATAVSPETVSTPAPAPAPAASTPGAAVGAPAPAAPAPAAPAPSPPADPWAAAAAQAEQLMQQAAPQAAPAAAAPAAVPDGAVPPTPTAVPPEVPAEGAAVVDTAPVESAPAADGAAPADAPPEGAEGAADPALTVELPGRRVGDKPLAFTANTPEEADRLRQAVNGYMRRNEFNERIGQVQSREAELRQVQGMIEASPAAFVMQHLAPDTQLEVARQLLAAHFEPLRDTIQQWWESDADRRLALAESREQSVTAQQQWSQAATVQQQVAAVQAAVQSLVPEDAAPADADEFYVDAVNHLAALSDTRPVRPEDVPQLLASRLRRYGFAAPASASPPPAAATPAPAAPPAAVPAAAPSARQAPAASGPAPARPPYQPSQALAAQRTAAAATTAPGATVSTLGVQTPPPEVMARGIEAAAEWYAQQLANRARPA